jgi:hypothetical protein
MRLRDLKDGEYLIRTEAFRVGDNVHEFKLEVRNSRYVAMGWQVPIYRVFYWCSDIEEVRRGLERHALARRLVKQLRSAIAKETGHRIPRAWAVQMRWQLATAIQTHYLAVKQHGA